MLVLFYMFYFHIFLYIHFWLNLNQTMRELLYSQHVFSRIENKNRRKSFLYKSLTSR